MEGLHRDGWTFEYHNLYADFYNVLNPVLGDQAQADALGKVNLRAGNMQEAVGISGRHGTRLFDIHHVVGKGGNLFNQIFGRAQGPEWFDD